MHQNPTVGPIGLAPLRQEHSVAQACEREPLRRGVIGYELLGDIDRHLRMKLTGMQ
jgi:hypothetical protein